MMSCDNDGGGGGDGDDDDDGGDDGDDGDGDGDDDGSDDSDVDIAFCPMVMFSCDDNPQFLSSKSIWPAARFSSTNQLLWSMCIKARAWSAQQEIKDSSSCELGIAFIVADIVGHCVALAKQSMDEVQLNVCFLLAMPIMPSVPGSAYDRPKHAPAKRDKVVPMSLLLHFN
eukprot:994-Pelagomonas_calceolata.AAC.2